MLFRSEEVLVTADGCEILTKFPADELLVAGRTYVRGADIAALERSDTLSVE